MTTSHQTDVLIAGGGPVGLGAAVELGHSNVNAIVLEPRSKIDHGRPRAKTTSVRTMEHFRRWGLADRIRAAAPIPVGWSNDVAFRTRLLGTEITRFQNCFGMRSDSDPRYSEPGQQIPQGVVEHVLREFVAESSNAQLWTGWKLETYDEDAEGVAVTAAHSDGTRREIRAKYLLGCDGGRSVTREILGARLEGTSIGRPNYNVVFKAPGLRQRLDSQPAVHYWIANADAPGIVGPLDLEDTWWAALFGIDQTTGDAHRTTLLQQMIGIDAHEIPIEVLSTDPWTARMLLADTFSSDRVFLLGDAAHQNPPFGGHGYNTGIGDAVNVGWKLAAVLNGWAAPEILRSYQAERRQVAQQTIQDAAENMSHLALDFADPDLERTDEVGESCRHQVGVDIQKRKKAEFHSLGLVLGYSYHDSPIVTASGNKQAPVPDPIEYEPSWTPGVLLPHWWIAPGESVYALLGKGLSLIKLADVDTSALVLAAQRRGIPLTVVDVSESFVRESVAGTAVLALVRPDQHLAWVADAAPEPQEFDAALEQILGHLASRV